MSILEVPMNAIETLMTTLQTDLGKMAAVTFGMRAITGAMLIGGLYLYRRYFESTAAPADDSGHADVEVM